MIAACIACHNNNYMQVGNIIVLYFMPNIEKYLLSSFIVSCSCYAFFYSEEDALATDYLYHAQYQYYCNQADGKQSICMYEIY